MRSDHVQLSLEIALLSLFFLAVLLAAPAVALTFTLVGELTSADDLPVTVGYRLEPRVYLVAFAVFATPIVTLLGTLLGVGWALRRTVARPVAAGAAPERSPAPTSERTEPDPESGSRPYRLP